jgi:hypothetical protein
VRRSGIEVLDISFLAYIGYWKSQTATEYLGIQRSLHVFLWLDCAFREADASEGHGAVVPRTLPGILSNREVTTSALRFVRSTAAKDGAGRGHGALFCSRTSCRATEK